MVSYTEYIGWVAKSNQDWLKFSSGNTAGEKAGFVTLSRNQRILTVADEGGNKVENFDILFDIDANLSVIERTGTVTITQNYNASPDGTKTITVVQSGGRIVNSTFTPVEEYNIIGSDTGLKFHLSLTNGHRKSLTQSDLVHEAIDPSLDPGGMVSPILPGNPIIRPNNGHQTTEASNDPVDDYMNDRYTFDDSPITPGYGALRAKLSCDINFIANVKFTYEGDIESPDDLYFWYKGEHILLTPSLKLVPIWYRASYKDIDGERVYYCGDALDYDNAEDKSIADAINKSTYHRGDGDVVAMSEVTNLRNDGLSDTKWETEEGEDWVKLSSSETYGYYEYEYNDSFNEVEPYVTFYDRKITINISDEYDPPHWSGNKMLEQLTQPANEFMPSYVSTGNAKTVAYLQYPESSGTTPSDGDFYVGSCSGSVGVYALIVRQLKYPSSLFTHIYFKRRVSGGLYDYSTNMSLDKKEHEQVKRRFAALNLNLDLTTINYVSQSAMNCTMVEEYEGLKTNYTATAYMNGQVIETIPYSGGNIDVVFSGTFEQDYITQCGDIIRKTNEFSTRKITTISKNTTDQPIQHVITSDLFEDELEILTGDTSSCSKQISFNCQATFMQEANTQTYVLKSTPENAIFSIGSLPSVDESDDTRKIGLNITSKIQD